MKKPNWKQKVIGAVLFCCLGIAPNEPAPTVQVAIDEHVSVRDQLKQQTEDEEKRVYAYYEEIYSGREVKKTANSKQIGGDREREGL